MFLVGLVAVDSLAGKAAVKCLDFGSFIDESQNNPRPSEICSLMLVHVNYGKPKCVAKFKGTDILIIGCEKHICILEYSQHQK